MSPGEARTIRPHEQANLVLGVPGLTRTDARRFALGVLNTALGGGMSSRLFQEIREKRGLAYSVYSFASQYADAGVFGVSAGCLPGKVDDVLETVRDELAKVAADGLTDEELERGKGQIKGGLVLGLEDTGSRMTRIGKAELVHGELLSIDELLDRIDAVTARRRRRARPGALHRSPSCSRSWGPRSPDAQRLAMIPITGGAFCSTTLTRKPPRRRFSEAFFTMLGTSSGRAAS